MEETLCLLFLCDLLGRVMFSELLTIIPGFLVLSIPMNLLKSRKRSMSVGIAENSGMI